MPNDLSLTSLEPGEEGYLSLDERMELSELKRARLIELERKIGLQEGLPFLHGWKWYTWAREFYESKNKVNLLCAANQISKSSTQIRKCINWATNEALWPELWVKRPRQFWYLYPTTTQVRAEFETKWQEFLPQGKYKTEAMLDGKPNLYAWKDIWVNKGLYAIHFFVAGVYVYFKTYAQDEQALQTGTVDALFCDEELPEHLYQELIFRISASRGYFHMVFTATLGQDSWRRAMEPEDGEVEFLPNAAKWTVSMFDCLTYEDGSPSHWTPEAIAEVIARCNSEEEVQKRVYGRFIMLPGSRKYEQYSAKAHLKHNPGPVPPDWLWFAGVDPGSGGEENHPAAICYVAVSPSLDRGRVVTGWRGDGIETASGDVFKKHLEMLSEIGKPFIGKYYDWADKDFGIISTRAGGGFVPADKSHESGEQILNTLFKNGMLTIDWTQETAKLSTELTTLKKSTPKRRAKDDFADALRYAVTRIPWDWSVIKGAPPSLAVVEKPKSDLARQIDERRGHVVGANEQEQYRIEEEFAELNDLAGV